MVPIRGPADVARGAENTPPLARDSRLYVQPKSAKVALNGSIRQRAENCGNPCFHGIFWVFRLSMMYA
jgi:hypothetical protein